MKHFNGFEQSLVDDVAELTKVITSNMLKLDIADFQPLQVLVSKRPATKVLHLVSELSHEKYPM